VSERGIEGNPKKISSIMNMEPVGHLKGAQRLVGCLVALNHLSHASASVGCPDLYNLLKKSEQFQWNEEA